MANSGCIYLQVYLQAKLSPDTKRFFTISRSEISNDELLHDKIRRVFDLDPSEALEIRKWSGAPFDIQKWLNLQVLALVRRHSVRLQPIVIVVVTPFRRFKLESLRLDYQRTACERGAS